MEVLVTILALGIGAAIIAPILWGVIGGRLGTWGAGVNIPARPTGGQAIVVSIFVWGLLIYLVMWAVGKFRPELRRETA